MATHTTPRDEVRTPPARLDIFGFEPTPARVEVIPRSRRWRVSKALTNLLLAWLAIPIVMFIPPHFPWVLAAFGIGIFRAWGFYKQRFTLVSMRGRCPKCAHELAVEKPTRLGEPHRMVCPNCHQTPVLAVDVAGLPAAA